MLFMTDIHLAPSNAVSSQKGRFAKSAFRDATDISGLLL